MQKCRSLHEKASIPDFTKLRSIGDLGSYIYFLQYIYICLTDYAMVKCKHAQPQCNIQLQNKIHLGKYIYTRQAISMASLRLDLDC